jgi:hypothetical protein
MTTKRTLALTASAVTFFAITQEQPFGINDETHLLALADMGL